MTSGEAVLLVALVALVAAAFLGAVERRWHGARIAANVCVLVAGIAIGVLGALTILDAPVNARFGDVLGQPLIDLRFDALAGVFLVALGVVSACVGIYALGYHDANRSSLDGVALAAFLAGMLLVFGSASVLSFLFAWEVMTIASAALVFGPHPDRVVARAGYIYLASAHLASGAIVVLFGVLAAAAGTLDMRAFHAAAATLPDWTRSGLFLLAVLGFGTKAGLVPLHVWLPRAHPVAPSHVSALMSGVMVGCGIYGLVRFAVLDLGSGPVWWAVVLLVMGVASAILGALYAFAERDLKRLLADSTVENMGLVAIAVGVAMLGESASMPSLTTLGLTAALVLVLNHALFKGLLFLGAGAVQEAAGTRDLDRLGGLVRGMPGTTLLVLVGATAAAALPPLNGFTGEWLTFQALLASAATPAVGELPRFGAYLAVAGVALAAALALATYVKAMGMTFLALPRSSGAAAAREGKPAMRCAMVVLAGACLLAGMLATSVAEVMHAVAEQAQRGPGHVAVRPTPDIDYGALVLAITLACLVVVVWAVLGWRHVGVRQAPTWACGVLHEPAFEYRATSLEKPARLFFEPVYRPQRQLHVERVPGTPFAARITYQTQVIPVVETRVYRPARRQVVRLAQLVRRVQDGSLQSYLGYIVVALIVLLLVAR